jgi:hypothetical protein
MRDKQLNALIMSQLLPAIQATTGLETVALARNFQPTQQGASSGSIVYFVKLFDKRYGWTQRKDTNAEGPGDFVHTERQEYETTYQFSALIPQDPAAVDALTESDVLNEVCGIMQSDTILQAFRAQGVGILRVTDVRNPYFTDDRDRFEAGPTFDIVFVHFRERVTTVPAVVAYDANLVRV